MNLTEHIPNTLVAGLARLIAGTGDILLTIHSQFTYADFLIPAGIAFNEKGNITRYSRIPLKPDINSD